VRSDLSSDAQSQEGDEAEHRAITAMSVLSYFSAKTLIAMRVLDKRPKRRALFLWLGFAASPPEGK
jgi:hypothetical protein